MVVTLIQKYPQALSHRGYQGRLPVMLAASRSSMTVPVYKEMWSQSPNSLMAQDPVTGLFPYQIAALPKKVLPRLRYNMDTDQWEAREDALQLEVIYELVKQTPELISRRPLSSEYICRSFTSAVGETKDASAVRWKQLVEHLRCAKSPCFTIPSLRDNLDWSGIQVGKGTFDLDSSCLPDPFLLAAKAAINYSALVGSKLMPACRPDSPISDDEEDEF